MLFIGNSKILFYFLSAKFRSASLGVCLPNFWCGRILLKSQCVCKSPSHPHGRVQESKIFGRDFLPLNGPWRIFHLNRQELIPVEIVQKRVCAALTGYFGAGLSFPVLSAAAQ